MRYYFAPMEGLTDSVYRRTHRKYFSGIDRYYMPFFSPTVHRTLSPHESRELPSACVEPNAVPQLLTKQPEDFLWAARVCRDLGYSEVNLNLGCPSGTVVAKGKGAGMLAQPDALARFFDAIFSAAPLPISVKTRLGMERSEEFPALLAVFNRYPIAELIVHPRVRTAFYTGRVDLEAYRFCLRESRSSVCYNGDLRSRADIEALHAQFPETRAVMLGRALIGNPGMLIPGGTTAPALEAFYGELLDAYLDVCGGTRNAMFRLKEHWRYLIERFDGGEALWKKLRKTTDLSEYKAITHTIFCSLPLRAEPATSAFCCAEK